MNKLTALIAAALLAMALAVGPAIADDDSDDDSDEVISDGSAPKSGVFEFVGYSSNTTPGDQGLRAIYLTCQIDFGPGSRMCTVPEFLLSPNAEAPGVAHPDDAWVHKDTEFSGQVIRNGTGVAAGKITIGNSITQCSVARPVTCCARLP